MSQQVEKIENVEFVQGDHCCDCTTVQAAIAIMEFKPECLEMEQKAVQDAAFAFLRRRFQIGAPLPEVTFTV